MREVLATRWSETGDKLLGLAEEFPEDKYEFRPVGEVRSFADQLRHVAFWNDYAAKSLRHEAADGKANELARATHPTKAKIVAALRESFAAVGAELAKSDATPDAAKLSTAEAFIEHNCEHYGQLVVYCRLNGIVPPASR